MNEPLTIQTERVDDIPLLLAQMQRMGIADLPDEPFPTHGNGEGLSLGGVTVIWLTHVHTPADHRMNHVQPWAERRLETLRACSDGALEVRDLGDDRLADVLRHLSDDECWRAFEQELTGQLVRVYDLKPSYVRLDSTTASSYGAVSEDGLLQLGHSKDHRPDLPQRKRHAGHAGSAGLAVALVGLGGGLAPAGRRAWGGDRSARWPEASGGGAGRGGGQATGEAGACGADRGRASRGPDRRALPGGGTARGDGERTTRRAAGACVPHPPCDGAHCSSVLAQQPGATRCPGKGHRAVGLARVRDQPGDRRTLVAPGRRGLPRRVSGGAQLRTLERASLVALSHVCRPRRSCHGPGAVVVARRARLHHAPLLGPSPL